MTTRGALRVSPAVPRESGQVTYRGQSEAVRSYLAREVLQGPRRYLTTGGLSTTTPVHQDTG